MGGTRKSRGIVAGPECGPRQIQVRTFFQLLTAALNAYIEYIRLQRDRHLDALEDRLDALAADGDPVSKLRMERVAKRIKRERERIIRSPDDHAEGG